MEKLKRQTMRVEVISIYVNMIVIEFPFQRLTFRVMIIKIAILSYLSVASQVLSFQYKSSVCTQFLRVLCMSHPISYATAHFVPSSSVDGLHFSLNVSIHRFYVFPFDSILSLDILSVCSAAYSMVCIQMDGKERTHISHTWHIQLNAS